MMSDPEINPENYFGRPKIFVPVIYTYKTQTFDNRKRGHKSISVKGKV